MNENNPIQPNKTADLFDDILADPFGDKLEVAKIQSSKQAKQNLSN
jgi:hypothetical protein